MDNKQNRWYKSVSHNADAPWLDVIILIFSCYFLCHRKRKEKHLSPPRQVLGVHITQNQNNIPYSRWQMKNNQNGKMRYKTFQRYSRVCVKSIVSCHAFGWGGFFAVGAAVGGSRGQVFTLDVSGWVLCAGTVKRQAPSFAGCGIRISLV